MSIATSNASSTTASSGSLNISIHPLVIINISDHFTRKKYIAGKAERVIGVLLGKQEGRNVEIFNSFEMDFTVREGKVVIDKEYLSERTDLYKKTFASYEPLGWYSTGFELQDSDIEVHKEMCAINENALYVLLDTRVAASDKELPLHVYESVVQLKGDAPTWTFVKTSYKLETVEAERISVDQVSHVQASGTSTAATALTGHLNGLSSAIMMLNQRIGIALQVLEAMQRGDIPMDHTLLRQVSSLVERLPTADSIEFQSHYQQDMNDTLLLSYLSTVTKGANTMNELIEKYNLAYEKHGRRRLPY